MLTSNAARASFDWRRFARDCRSALRADDRGYRTLAREIGVTISDLSRAAGGSNVSVEKVIALCDFLGRDVRDYYLPPLSQMENPEKSNCFTGCNVKQRPHHASSNGEQP